MPYKELCNMYKNARDHYFRAHSDAIHFAESVYLTMKDYMGLQEENSHLLRILPSADKVEEGVTYTPENSVMFGESTDWEFSIQLELHLNADAKIFPPEVLKFNFFYKKNEDVVSYRYIAEMKDYEVKEQELLEHLMKVCFPDMEQTVEKIYQAKLAIYSKDLPTQRKIGLN